MSGVGDMFNDMFGGMGKSAAWKAGRDVRVHICETARDLGDWFDGFAAACKEAREYRWAKPEKKK